MESDSESVSKKRRFTAADFRQRSFTSPLERTADNSYNFENDRTAFTGWKKRLRKTIYGKEVYNYIVDRRSVVVDKIHVRVLFLFLCVEVVFPTKQV